MVYLLNYAMIAWAAAGLLFAVAFVTVGIERLDDQSRGTSWWFRALLVPGVVIFWPLLLRRWLTGRRTV